jgi:phage-related protein
MPASPASGGLASLGSRRASRDLPRGVFAVPVTRNFYVSHQWLRELKRHNAGRTVAAIYFRVPDDEQVWSVATTRRIGG